MHMILSLTLYNTLYNWSLQSVSQDYDLVFHTTYVVHITFIHEWCDLQFKVASERQIFEKHFMATLFHFQSICRKSAERKSPTEIFFHVCRFVQDV